MGIGSGEGRSDEELGRRGKGEEKGEAAGVGDKRTWRGRRGKREDLSSACFLGPAQPRRKC